MEKNVKWFDEWSSVQCRRPNAKKHPWSSEKALFCAPALHRYAWPALNHTNRRTICNANDLREGITASTAYVHRFFVFVIRDSYSCLIECAAIRAPFSCNPRCCWFVDLLSATLWKQFIMQGFRFRAPSNPLIMFFLLFTEIVSMGGFTTAID